MLDWTVVLGGGGALAGVLLFLKIVANEVRFWNRVLELKKQHAPQRNRRAPQVGGQAD